MKHLLSLLILTLSINCYSQSNRRLLEDIEDRLDMMEYENALKDIQRSRNQQNSNFTSDDSFIQKTDKVLIRNSNITVAINSETLRRVSIGTASDKYMFLSIHEFDRPQFDNSNQSSIPYYKMIYGNTLDCRNKKISIYSVATYDKGFRKLSDVSFPEMFRPIQKNSVPALFAAYICK